MKRVLWLLIVLVLLCLTGWAQSRETPSLGDLARRVRAERAKKDLSRIPYYTNYNLPRGGFVTVLGRRRPSVTQETAAEAEQGGAGGEATAEASGDECDEQCWRGKFAEKREQIQLAERELDVLQREFNLARRQYYTDPNRAVQEQYSANTSGGRELQELKQKGDAKQAEIDKLNQDLQELERELRRAGKPAGWARE